MTWTAPIRILLVEDSESCAELTARRLAAGLEDRAHEIIPVVTLAAALQVVASSPLDVVVVDLGLPDATGVQAVQALHAASPTLPILVVSGSEQSNVAEACIDFGATGFLSKRQVEEMPKILAQEVIVRVRRAQRRVQSQPGATLAQAETALEGLVSRITAAADSAEAHLDERSKQKGDN